MPDDMSYLHPDSYAFGRPNPRSGYGGNYQRPNAGFQLHKPLFSSNQQQEQLSSRQPTDYTRSLSSTLPSHSPGPTLTYEDQSNVAPDPSIKSPTSIIQSSSSIRLLSPPPSADLIPQPHPTSSFDGLVSSLPPRIASTSVSNGNGHSLPDQLKRPIRIEWFVKSSDDIHLDKRLASLVNRRIALGRLNQSQHCLVLLVLLTIENDSSGGSARDDSDDEGVDARLRQALQLTRILTPRLMNTGSTNGNGHEVMINGFGPNKHVSSPTQGKARKASCDSISSSDSGSDEKGGFEDHDDKVIDGSDQLSTSPDPSASSTGDHQQQKMINNAFGQLRRVSKYLSVRLEREKKRLDKAQLRMTQVRKEQESLRNQLDHLATNAGTNDLSLNSGTPTLSSTDMGAGCLPGRFDRWHKTASDMTQLLCQLARRMAINDARIKCSTLFDAIEPEADASQSSNVENGSSRATDASAVWNSRLSVYDSSIVTLLQQKDMLRSQIKEAQGFHTELERSRIRILEGISTLLDHNSNLVDDNDLTMSSPSPPPNAFDDGEDDDEVTIVIEKLDAAIESGSDRSPSTSLCDQLARHFSQFLQGITDLQVIETCIRIDQEIFDNVSEELRFEASS